MKCVIHLFMQRKFYFLLRFLYTKNSTPSSSVIFWKIHFTYIVSYLHLFYFKIYDFTAFSYNIR